MSHISKYIERVSLEDFAVAEVEIEDEGKVKAEPESIDAIVEDLVEIDAKADSIRAEIEEVQDIQTSLEHFGTLIEQAQARGGMRPEEGVLVGAALQHFQKRLGINTQVLSMEDFGGNMPRGEATRVSLEAFGDTTKAAVEKLKELFRRMMAWLKEKLTFRAEKLGTIGDFIKGFKQGFRQTSNTEAEVEVKIPVRLGFRDVALQNSALNSMIEGFHDATEIINDNQRIMKQMGVLVKAFHVNGGSKEAFAQFQKDLAEIAPPTKSDVRLSGAVTLTGLAGDDVTEYKDVTWATPVRVERQINEHNTTTVTIRFQMFSSVLAKLDKLYRGATAAHQAHELVAEQYGDVLTKAQAVRSNQAENGIEGVLSVMNTLAGNVRYCGSVADEVFAVLTSLVAVFKHIGAEAFGVEVQTPHG